MADGNSSSDKNGNEDTGKKQKTADDYNILRDTALRYLGYCNEVGESFRYQAPRLVTPSYVISFGYCCADAVQAGWKVWSSAPPGAAAGAGAASDQRVRQQESLRATVDTIIWQTTASVLVPGFTINCIVKASRWFVRRPAVTAVLPAMVFSWFPTVAGLGSIPFIVHPIDHATDVVLDETLRKIWKPVDLSADAKETV